MSEGEMRTMVTHQSTEFQQSIITEFIYKHKSIKQNI